MAERYDTPALRRLRFSWPWIAGLWVFNLGLLAVFLWDASAVGWAVDRVLPQFLKANRSGEWGEHIDDALVFLGLPTLVITLNMMLWLRSRVIVPLLRDLRVVPNTERLERQLLFHWTFVINLVLLLAVEFAWGFWTIQWSGRFPSWVFALPVGSAAIVWIDTLRLREKINPTPAIFLIALLWISFYSEWTGVIWFYLCSFAFCAVIFAGFVFSVESLKKARSLMDQRSVFPSHSDTCIVGPTPSKLDDK